MSKPLSVASIVPSSIGNPCLCHPSPPHLLHFIPPALGEFSHSVPLLTVFPWPRTWSDIPPMMLPACPVEAFISFKSQSWALSAQSLSWFPHSLPSAVNPDNPAITGCDQSLYLKPFTQLSPSRPWNTWGPRQHLIGYYVHKTAQLQGKSQQIFVKLNRTKFALCQIEGQEIQRIISLPNWQAWIMQKTKGIFFFFFLWLMTFWFPRGSTRASLLSLSMAIPSRGELCRKAFGTASRQLILHLKKHLDSFGTVCHCGQFVWLHKHNATSFQKARFFVASLALWLFKICLFALKCTSKA